MDASEELFILVFLRKRNLYNSRRLSVDDVYGNKLPTGGPQIEHEEDEGHVECLRVCCLPCLGCKFDPCVYVTRKYT